MRFDTNDANYRWSTTNIYSVAVSQHGERSNLCSTLAASLRLPGSFSAASMQLCSGPEEGKLPVVHHNHQPRRGLAAR